MLTSFWSAGQILVKQEIPGVCASPRFSPWSPSGSTSERLIICRRGCQARFLQLPLG
jgi:hypothetical protein